METVTLADAIQMIKDNPYKEYVIRLGKDFRICLCEVKIVENEFDGYNIIAFISK